MFAYRFAGPVHPLRAGLAPIALAAGVAFSLAAVIATLPHAAPFAPATSPAAPVTITLSDATASPTVLRDRALALRDRLLAMPETGAVSLDGIVLQRLVVEFRPSHLAALGLTSADLEAAVPTDPAASSPGHLVLTPAAASAGLQAIENLPVHAGAKVFRLGDIALVARAPLDQPVFTLWQHGHPAVRLKIVTLDAR